MRLLFDCQDIIEEFIGKELEEFYYECRQMKESMFLKNTKNYFL